MSTIMESVTSDLKQGPGLGGLPATGKSEIRIRGKARYAPSVEIFGRTVVSSGKWIKVAAVRDEELVEGDTTSDLRSFVSILSKSQLQADIFTFTQRPPDSQAKFGLRAEWESAAALTITSYDHWFKNCTEYSIRKGVNRAKKLGVDVRRVQFDDRLLEDIHRMYSQTPVRQGKAFWHYGKDLATLKHELATYLDRSVFLGAYFGGELIGSMKMTYVGPAAAIMQIFSLREHFDKRPNNALIAKAVEVCEADAKQYLIYGSFVYHDPDSSLTEFKRRNGFESMALPRYYVPLTVKGKLAMSLGLHRPFAANLPKPVLQQMLKMRRAWYSRRTRPERATA